MINPQPVVIGKIGVEKTNGVTRLAAEVDGSPVWYESADTELLPRGEVFASAFLLPAMKSGRGLQIQGAGLSARWLSNAQELMKRFNAWWGYSVIEIRCDSTPVLHVKPAPCETGLFFTGGVDSFYTLLTAPEKIDDLIYVQGFDCSHRDETRFVDAVTHISKVADVRGCHLLVVKSNLREHPLYRAMDWTKTHGGALVSVSYALGRISRQLISSSYGLQYMVPCGSHPETDPLWSNEQLTFVHYGAEAVRLEKLSVLADNPLVQEHLRVCWKNPGHPHNCCQCEKCIRNMLILKSLGKLASFAAFPLQAGLFWRACCISTIPASNFANYYNQLQHATQWQTRLAIRIMLARSWFRNTKRDYIKALLGKKST